MSLERWAIKLYIFLIFFYIINYFSLPQSFTKITTENDHLENKREFSIRCYPPFSKKECQKEKNKKETFL